MIYIGPDKVKQNNELMSGVLKNKAKQNKKHSKSNRK